VKRGQGFLPVAGCHHPVAFAAKQAFQTEQAGFMVISD
jgi:hypothetical protein